MEYLTTQQAAERLGLSLRQVQTLIKKGDLLAKKFGHAWQIKRKDVEDFERRPVGRPRKKTDHDDNSTIT